MSEKDYCEYEKRILTEAIAAAEERGRRAGFAECREAAARVCDGWLDVVTDPLAARPWRVAAETIRKLAPRDSARCEASLGRLFPPEQNRCVLLAGHEGDHQALLHAWKQAPRDSAPAAAPQAIPGTHAARREREKARDSGKDTDHG